MRNFFQCCLIVLFLPCFALPKASAASNADVPVEAGRLRPGDVVEAEVVAVDARAKRIVVSRGKGAAKTTLRRLIAAEDTQPLEILAMTTAEEHARMGVQAPPARRRRSNTEAAPGVLQPQQ